jgi:WD repeat-containing protein 68
MEPERKASNGEVETSESQVITYQAPWNIFAIGFSNKQSNQFRLGIASFLPDVKNEVTALLNSD